MKIIPSLILRYNTRNTKGMTMFDIPILLLTYKKTTALKVLEQIIKVTPRKVYIASNHWKNDAESQAIQDLRNQMQNMITSKGMGEGDCKVDFIYRTEHLNCKESISSSIAYFFEREEWGIVLEDDCVPTQSFFYFCEEMLKRYKDNPQIFMISGWSALDLNPEAKKSLNEDYFFSKYNHIWGWASWRRVWQLYQKEFNDFEKEFAELEVFDSQEESRYWYKILKKYSKGKIDTWDYPFTYTMWKHKALSIYPKNNMINNIGFNNQDAAHTTSESKFQNLKTYDHFSLKTLSHPEKIQRNLFLDRVDYEISFKPPIFFKRVINKISRILFSKNIFKV